MVIQYIFIELYNDSTLQTQSNMLSTAKTLEYKDGIPLSFKSSSTLKPRGEISTC